MYINEENLMENIGIKDLKISKFGWTNVYARRNDGTIKCILIKKNLFKGYTIMDETLTKRKIADLTSIELSDLSVIKHLQIKFLSKAAFANLQGTINFVNLRRQNELNYFNNQVNDLHKNIALEQQAHQNDVHSIREQHRKEHNDSLREKLSYLRSPFKSITTGEWTEEGTDIEYEKPNKYQIEMGRTIGNEVRKPYKREGNFSLNMEDYLYTVGKEIDEKYKSAVSELQNMEYRIRVNTDSLDREYSESLYIQIIGQIVNFTTALNNLLIEYKMENPDSELSFYSSSAHNGQNDEEVRETRRVRKLVQAGIDACANLMDKFISSNEKDKFLATMEQVSKKQDGDSPKKM